MKMLESELNELCEKKRATKKAIEDLKAEKQKDYLMPAARLKI